MAITEIIRSGLEPVKQVDGNTFVLLKDGVDQILIPLPSGSLVTLKEITDENQMANFADADFEDDYLNFDFRSNVPPTSSEEILYFINSIFTGNKKGRVVRLNSQTDPENNVVQALIMKNVTIWLDS